MTTDFILQSGLNTAKIKAQWSKVPVKLLICKLFENFKSWEQ